MCLSAGDFATSCPRCSWWAKEKWGGFLLGASCFISSLLAKTYDLSVWLFYSLIVLWQFSLQAKQIRGAQVRCWTLENGVNYFGSAQEHYIVCLSVVKSLLLINRIWSKQLWVPSVTVRLSCLALWWVRHSPSPVPYNVCPSSCKWALPLLLPLHLLTHRNFQCESHPNPVGVNGSLSILTVDQVMNEYFLSKKLPSCSQKEKLQM